MNECDKIRKAIGCHLMEPFKYCHPFLYLTPYNNIACLRISRVNLYSRIRKKRNLFPPDCPITARIGLKKERVGHGFLFIGALAEIALKYGFKYIELESTNEKSSAFAESLSFHSTDSSNHVVSAENSIDYPSNIIL